MRIFKAIVAVLVIFSAFTFWRAGQIPQGDLQTLQPPAAETPQPDTPERPTPPPPEAVPADPTDPTIFSVTLSPDQVETLSGTWITVTAHITGGQLELRLPPINSETASPSQQQRLFLPSLSQ